MVGPSPSPSHHIFSIKSSSPSSSSTISCSSMKLKTLLQTFIFSHLYRIARALTKAKSILAQLFKDIHLLHLLELPMMMMKKNKNKNNKLFFGSFRLHYNWCSSHVMPMPTPNVRESFTPTNYLYYDSSWNSMVSTECDSADDDQSSELSGYLQWLEEKAAQQDSSSGNDINEIDRLADMFIASCHEKFRLEKQESYRRFQEMMARSV